MFEGLTVWGRAAIILEVLAGIVLLILLLRWAFTGKKVRFGLGGASLDVEKQPTSHGLVVEVDLVIEIVSRTVDTASKISHIKTKQILSDQMYYLEDRLVVLQDKFMTAFRGMLFGELTKKSIAGSPVTVTSTQEYSFFTTLVFLMAEDLKRSCRGTFIRNNFHRFNDREFDAYVNDKVDFLWIKATSFIRDMYPSDKMTVPFEVLEKVVFSEIEDDVCEELRITFKKAVQIYNERHAEIHGMEASLREHLRSYGVDLEKTAKSAEGDSKND